MQPRVNTSRPEPGRAATRRNRCPQGPPQLIDKSLIHTAITHTRESSCITFHTTPAVRHSSPEAKNGTTLIFPLPPPGQTARPHAADGGGLSSCRGGSRPIPPGFPPMRAEIARRRGRKHTPRFPGGALTGWALASSSSAKSLRNLSFVVPVLIPRLPAGSHRRNAGGCAGRGPAFPGLRVIRLSSDTRFRWASPSCAGVNTGVPRPAAYKGRTPGPDGPGVPV